MWMRSVPTRSPREAEEDDASGRDPSASGRSCGLRAGAPPAKLLPPAKDKLALVITVRAYLSGRCGPKSPFHTSSRTATARLLPPDVAPFPSLGRPPTLAWTYGRSGGLLPPPFAVRARAGAGSTAGAPGSSGPRRRGSIAAPDRVLRRGPPRPACRPPPGARRRHVRRAAAGAAAVWSRGRPRGSATVQWRVENAVDPHEVPPYEKWRQEMERPCHPPRPTAGSRSPSRRTRRASPGGKGRPTQEKNREFALRYCRRSKTWIGRTNGGRAAHAEQFGSTSCDTV